MHIEPIVARKSWVGKAALIGSAAIHALVLLVFITIATGAVKESYTVEMFVKDATPEATPEPPKKEPPPKKTPPPPNEQVKTPTNEPPKPVFGATKDSVVDGDSSMSVRVGNTLMKEPEKEFTDPSKVKPYSAPEVYQQSELDHAPRVKNMLKPANREGVVKVRFLVGKDGRVSNVKVLSAPAGLGFEEAAVSAVKQWTFETPTVRGQPVSAWIVQSIRFQLE
jgi:protein TonB